MEEKNPQDILNDFKGGKIDLSTLIEKLLSESSSRDDNLRLEISDVLLEIYRIVEAEENRESKQLRSIMEEKIGEKFISKYNLHPREAMALGLVELIMRVNLENCDVIPNIPHVHAAFGIKGSHVIDLDIVEMRFPKLVFLDLLSYLETLTISQAGLKEIEGLEKLKELTLLDLAANELLEIKGLEHLQKLKKLYAYSNKIPHLKGLNSLSELEELLIHENPIKTLKGIESLKKLKNIEIHETYLSEKEIKKIKDLIKIKN